MNFNKDIKFIQSPNFSNKEIIPKLIVIHWTAGSYNGSINWFKNPKAQASAHFIIKADGSEITQMVNVTKKAWHAGGMSYHPFTGINLNESSIGIELEGPPSIIHTKEWNDNMITLLGDFCKWLKNQIPSIKGITDHSTILPMMKSDVLGGLYNDKFPWYSLVLRSELTDMATDEIRNQVVNYFKKRN